MARWTSSSRKVRKRLLEGGSYRQTDHRGKNEALAMCACHAASLIEFLENYMATTLDDSGDTFTAAKYMAQLVRLQHMLGTATGTRGVGDAALGSAARRNS